MSGFRGTNIEQDLKFSNKKENLLKQTKFPLIYGTKIDMKKIKFDTIKPWISQRLTHILGFEDEIVINLIYCHLEESQYPDAKTLQINLTGFLEEDTENFMLELWGLLIDAQQNSAGIPTLLIDEKKKEIQQLKQQEEFIKEKLSAIRASARPPSFQFSHQSSNTSPSYPSKTTRLTDQGKYESSRRNRSPSRPIRESSNRSNASFDKKTYKSTRSPIRSNRSSFRSPMRANNNRTNGSPTRFSRNYYNSNEDSNSREQKSEKQIHNSPSYSTLDIDSSSFSSTTTSHSSSDSHSDSNSQ